MIVRSLIILAALVIGGNAYAEEPVSTTSTPVAVSATVVAPDGIMHNRRGLFRNGPAVGMMYDVDGCPVAYTNGAQFVEADDLATMVDASADARATCTRAKAAAQATTTRAQGELAKAKADAGATLVLAVAGADAVTTAADRGKATYVDANAHVAATGNAAPLAAASSGSGYAPLGTLAYGQAAWALTRSPVVTDASSTTTGGNSNSGDSSGSTAKPESSATTTVSEAEARADAALKAAGIE